MSKRTACLRGEAPAQTLLRFRRFDRKAPFKTDRERAEHLLGLYEQVVSPLGLGAAAPAAKKARRRQ